MFKATDDISKLVLIEIGPRFSLNPIKAFEGPMGGEALWQNQFYIGPPKLRSKRFETFQKKRDAKLERKEYKQAVVEEGRDPDAYLDDAFSQSEEENEVDSNE